MQRISGRDVTVSLPSGRMALFDQVNLNPASGVAAVTSGGYPAGWVYGDVSGDGDIVIDPEELQKLLDEAEKHGSWEAMPAIDMTLFAKVGAKEWKFEVFGAKFDFPDFKADRKGGDKLTHTVKFLVTGEDFIHINGVPLARRQT